MPSEIVPRIEQRIVAFSLVHTCVHCVEDPRGGSGFSTRRAYGGRFIEDRDARARFSAPGMAGRAIRGSRRAGSQQQLAPEEVRSPQLRDDRSRLLRMSAR